MMNKAMTLLSLLLISTCSHSAIELAFGVYASDKPTAMVQQFKPLLNQIEQDLTQQLKEPVHIRLQIAADYDTGIEDLVKSRVDFARFGPASYVTAKAQAPAIQILAMETQDGQKRFNGIICVHKDSPIERIEQLKGKRFAFGDPLSTIGRYLVQQYLIENNIYAKDLAGYEYIERHDRVGTSVALGLFDAGALKQNTFDDLVKKGEPLREIVRFENVTKPWLSSPTLNPRIAEALSHVLYELASKPALQGQLEPLVAGRDEDYAQTRQAMLISQSFEVE